ncbi:hypothetical protein OIE67_04885 [Nonomuraea fuscirosea]|jgi:hypothetical protein|uniref:SCO4225 family membrane protein n=1 Tax=Nonomuraea fuscirosea TaxID=1291556 RepID=UPI002DD93FFA|nr:hypothetical protein [Nonomuraea fuscirosea]WSA53974.1 hypothetical protein OIE67_04885 [Nonomuraea fuscirosea]
MTSLREYVSRYDRGRRGLAIAGAYALLVLLVAAYVEISTRLAADSQGLEGIYLFIVTAPTSWLVMLLPVADVLPPEVYLALLVGVGLLQAWVLWLLTRGRRVAHHPRQPG